jgi:hypothetical protein
MEAENQRCGTQGVGKRLHCNSASGKPSEQEREVMHPPGNGSAQRNRIVVIAGERCLTAEGGKQSREKTEGIPWRRFNSQGGSCAHGARRRDQNGSPLAGDNGSGPSASQVDFSTDRNNASSPHRFIGLITDSSTCSWKRSSSSSRIRTSSVASTRLESSRTSAIPKSQPLLTRRSTTLLAEYAYVLQPGGILYTVTDVKGKSFHPYLAHL